jgi:hypothetical protein
MNILTTLEHDIEEVPVFLKNALAKITGVASTVGSDVESAVGLSINVLNGIKGFIASPAGKDLELIITAIPGIGPYATDILNYLPQALIDLNLVKTDFNKSPAQLVIDGVTAAVNATSPNSKVAHLTAIAASVLTKVTELQQAPVTMQTALTLIPAKYAALATDVSTLIQSDANPPS